MRVSSAKTSGIRLMFSRNGTHNWVRNDSCMFQVITNSYCHDPSDRPSQRSPSHYVSTVEIKQDNSNGLYMNSQEHCTHSLEFFSDTVETGPRCTGRSATRVLIPKTKRRVVEVSWMIPLAIRFHIQCTCSIGSFSSPKSPLNRKVMSS